MLTKLSLCDIMGYRNLKGEKVMFDSVFMSMHIDMRIERRDDSIRREDIMSTNLHAIKYRQADLTCS